MYTITSQQLIVIKQKEHQALKFCRLYHKEKNTKRKQKYLDCCINSSIKFERLEKDDKSF